MRRLLAALLPLLALIAAPARAEVTVYETVEVQEFIVQQIRGAHAVRRERI